MHSGNVGHAQNLDTLIRATTFLRDLDDLAVVIVGFGARHAELVALAERLEADTVPLPAVPAARGAAAVALVARTSTSSGSRRGSPATSSRAGSTGSSPSGRPVIVAADAESETAQVVAEVGCGVVVPPGRPDLLAAAIRELVTTASTTSRRWAAAAARTSKREADRQVALSSATARC